MFPRSYFCFLTILLSDFDFETSPIPVNEKNEGQKQVSLYTLSISLITMCYQTHKLFANQTKHITLQIILSTKTPPSPLLISMNLDATKFQVQKPILSIYFNGVLIEYSLRILVSNDDGFYNGVDRRHFLCSCANSNEMDWGGFYLPHIQTSSYSNMMDLI